MNVEVPARTEISAVAIDEAGLLIGFLSLDFLNLSKEYLLRSPALRKTPALHKSGEAALGGISIVLTMYYRVNNVDSTSTIKDGKQMTN